MKNTQRANQEGDNDWTLKIYIKNNRKKRKRSKQISKQTYKKKKNSAMFPRHLNNTKSKKMYDDF